VSVCGTDRSQDGTIVTVQVGSAPPGWYHRPRAGQGFPTPGPDGLLSDAWIGFPKEREVGASTREDVCPFSIEEQERILVGAARLTCHARTSTTRRDALADFGGTLKPASRRCVLPRIN
jgi:hypothetical protein